MYISNLYQHLPKGAVWTLRDGKQAPLIIHSAPLGRPRYRSIYLTDAQTPSRKSEGTEVLPLKLSSLDWGWHTVCRRDKAAADQAPVLLPCILLMCCEIPRNSETFLSLWHLDWGLPYMCERSWVVLVPGLLWDNIVGSYGDYICDVKVVAWWQAWIYNECVVKHMHRITSNAQTFASKTIGPIFFKCWFCVNDCSVLLRRQTKRWMAMEHRPWDFLGQTDGSIRGSCAIRHPLRNPGVILSLHSRHDGILSCIQRFFYLFLFTCDNPGTAALKENKTIYHIQK